MRRILVVDDDILIQIALSKVLKTFTPDVRTVSTGKEALQEVKSSFYPLCFLDVCLPDANGLSLMRAIKELSPKTKIVIMTGNYIDDNMKRAIEDASFDFLPKPFDLSQVRAIAVEGLEDI